MIFGTTNDKIVKLAVENQSTHFNGVVQYDYESGKIYGCAMSPGETENPDNPVIEIFRLNQGERGEIDCRCWESSECPYWIDDDNDYIGGHLDEDKIVDNKCRKECCMEAYIDVDFEDDWEMYHQENVERQVRNVLSNHLSDTINKLEEIYIAINDILTPWKYIEIRANNNYYLDVLDSYVDAAIDFGFTLDDPISYLDAEIQRLIDICEYSENEKLIKVGKILNDKNLDEALNILHQ